MRNSTALESIQFQKSDLFNEITQCIKSMRNLRNITRERALVGKEVDQLKSVIAKHTGLNYTFVDNGHGFTAYTPILHKHIFDAGPGMKKFTDAVDDIDHHFNVKKVMEAMNATVISGSVDLKGSKVTGFFTKLDCYMSIPRFMLNDKTYLDEELAALALHEIGHSFTSFEYLSRSVTTNQALSLMLRTMDKTTSYEERNIVFTHAIDTEKIKLDADARKLLQANLSPESVSMLVINQQIEACKSELGASVYDAVSCEYLADQFAARHGAGRYLISVLDKFSGRAGPGSFGDYFQIGLYSMFAAATLLTVGAPLLGLITGVGFMLLGSTSQAYKASKFDTEFIYDNDETRMKRIKHQLVERLKDPECPAEEKKFILDYIREVEPIVKKYEGESSPKLRNRIAFFFSKKHKYDFEFMSLQKDLEELGNSNLFVMSEKLKAL